MKKYIIIETWNGEGYTDSSAEIMEFKSHEQAGSHCLGKAYSQAEAMGTKSYRLKEGNGFGYEDHNVENAGAYAFIEMTDDVIGVVLNPCINDYEVVTDVKRWDDLVEFAWKHGTIEEDQEDFGEGKVNNQYIHSGGESGDALFIELDNKEKSKENDYFKRASKLFLTEELSRSEFGKILSAGEILPTTTDYEDWDVDYLEDTINLFAEEIEKEVKEKDKIIEELKERLNASHNAMDDSTDRIKEMGLDLEDSEAYVNLLEQLAPNEELLKRLN